MTKPILIIFAKSPRMGVSKTRLAKGIGTANAWRVKRALDAFTCRVAMGSPVWQTRLAVAPSRDEQAAFPGAWPKDLPRIGQGTGDLGQRMAGALRRFGQGPVCIIGSDLPGLQTRDLSHAFSMLRRKDVVFGPASDGGFWLIGMSARYARKARLEGIEWSSPTTLAETLASLPSHWRVGFLRELEDVDDGASYSRTSRPTKPNTSPS
jgi:uncharacterized protein